ncbi:MAG: hypothetical protein IPP31_10825 [Chitinophagaceae bacterium]|nr:hypothetical protein [Chitinophagaceae bacterium]
MKRFFLFLILLSGLARSYSQEVRIADTVLFIDNKPIAYIFAELNNSSLKYNVEIYSLFDQLLIRADVVKFSAPVEQLKPFYYYEMGFPTLPDSLSIYLEDEAFPVVMAKMIRDYKLIKNDQLDRLGVERLRSQYPGVTAFAAKVQGVTNYLNETRNFAEQVLRDRTKPVVVINNRVIMQDGRKIGTVSEYENIQVTNRTDQIQPMESESVYNVTAAYKAIIYYESGRRVSYDNAYTPYLRTLRKGELGYKLYEISKTRNNAPGSYADELLKRICYYIEDFGL